MSDAKSPGSPNGLPPMLTLLQGTAQATRRPPLLSYSGAATALGVLEGVFVLPSLLTRGHMENKLAASECRVAADAKTASEATIQPETAGAMPASPFAAGDRV